MLRNLAHRSPFGLAALGPFPVVSLALVVFAAAALMYGLARRPEASPAPAAAAPRVSRSLHGAAPSAREFGRQLTGLANQFAAEQGAGARLDKVDCAQGSQGHYMCSFALLQ